MQELKGLDEKLPVVRSLYNHFHHKMVGSVDMYQDLAAIVAPERVWYDLDDGTEMKGKGTSENGAIPMIKLIGRANRGKMGPVFAISDGNMNTKREFQVLEGEYLRGKYLEPTDEDECVDDFTSFTFEIHHNLGYDLSFNFQGKPDYLDIKENLIEGRICISHMDAKSGGIVFFPVLLNSLWLHFPLLID
jgi:hypothetical protein